MNFGGFNKILPHEFTAGGSARASVTVSPAESQLSQGDLVHEKLIESIEKGLKNKGKLLHIPCGCTWKITENDSGKKLLSVKLGCKECGFLTCVFPFDIK